tara:strand:- start:467 stop:1117 length:651 start_codon:yes stop_codon:yes gene_type:complete
MNLGQNYASSNDPNLYRRNVNQNLVGMNTQFMNNSINGNRILQDKNEYGNAMVENNVLPHPGLKSTLINRPYKLVLYKDVNADNVPHVFTLNETLKDVVSVKLVNCLINTTEASVSDFLVLKINEIKKNISTSGSNNFNDSFAIIDIDETAQLIYKNNGTYEDIKYFDPPLNSLNKLTFSVYGGGGGTELDGKTLNTTFTIKLELIVETKEKLRVY